MCRNRNYTLGIGAGASGSMVISCPARPVVLIASRLIDQRHDANAREAAHQDLATVCDVMLLFLQGFRLPGGQNNVANVRQN
jgi:hypothetical protein